LKLYLSIDRVRTPIGDLYVVSDHDGVLRAADWVDHEARMIRLLGLHYSENGFALDQNRSDALRLAITAYFAGDLAAIDILSIQTAGTAFQCLVWRALRAILAGSTTSYTKLAERIGRPSAIRAVGLANASNPIAIVVPCHRVIGSNGALVGYAGGIERKRWLLEHEDKFRGLQRYSQEMETVAQPRHRP
jgi:methylated-DNA-[protein]-cysteine S-methyltransferase